MDPQDNVTIRRAHTTLIVDRNVTDMSIDALDVSGSLCSSLPDLSTDNRIVNELQQKLDKLQTELNSAHLEIEQLSLENKELRKNNQELCKKNSMYRKIGFSPTNRTTSNTPPRKPAKQLRNNKEHKHTQTDKLEKENTVGKVNIGTQTHATISTEKTLPENKNSPQNLKKIPNIAKLHERPVKHQNHSTYKPKICLISSNGENKVLSIAQEIMPSKKYDFCHYLSSQATTRHMIRNLQTKLTDFTENDYCIIFISEEDLLETSNHFEQIKHIRETLKEITHTNIVLCTPTYQIGHQRDYFNQKVYSFNELLLKDVNTFKYAHVIDSNRYLCYDYTMFHKPSGRISNLGLRIVLQDVLYFTENLKSNVEHRRRTYYKVLPTVSDINQFFRE